LTSKIGEWDRLILDRGFPQQESRLGIGTNPVEIDEASQFTLEAELIRLTNLVKETAESRTKRRVTNSEIKIPMKQAEEDRDKVPERSTVAFKHVQSTKGTCDASGKGA
jgi:hypothetical protein